MLPSVIPKIYLLMLGPSHNLIALNSLRRAVHRGRVIQMMIAHSCPSDLCAWNLDQTWLTLGLAHRGHFSRATAPTYHVYPLAKWKVWLLRWSTCILIVMMVTATMSSSLKMCRTSSRLLSDWTNILLLEEGCCGRCSTISLFLLMHLMLLLLLWTRWRLKHGLMVDHILRISRLILLRCLRGVVVDNVDYASDAVTYWRVWIIHQNIPYKF